MKGSSPRDAAASLLDPELLSLLHGYRIATQRSRVAGRPGPHRSQRPGDGLEFVEYRDYQPGDPTRWIDWRVLARTDRPYVRRFGHETAVDAHLFVDGSASMGVGFDGPTKLRWALGLAAYLAIVLSRQGDRVRLSVFRDELDRSVEGLALGQGVAQGNETLRRLERELSGVESRGRTNLDEVLERVERVRPQIVFVLSDFFFDPSASEVFERLLQVADVRRLDLRLVHVLDPRELDFSFEGFGRFEDPEEPSFRMEVSPRAIRERYAEALERFLRSLETRAADRGVQLERFVTRTPLKEAVLRYLEEA